MRITNDFNTVRNYRNAIFRLLLLPLLFINESQAQVPTSADIDLLKIAYTYNFSKYFTWPESNKWNTSDEINLCVQNSSYADGGFSSLSGNHSQNKTIKLINLNQTDVSIQNECHIWFIDRKNFPAQDAPFFSDFHYPGILTISDYPGFAEMGGVIEFVEVENRVKFKINVMNATNKELKASSLILELGLTHE